MSAPTVAVALGPDPMYPYYRHAPCGRVAEAKDAAVEPRRLRWWSRARHVATRCRRCGWRPVGEFRYVESVQETLSHTGDETFARVVVRQHWADRGPVWPAP